MEYTANSDKITRDYFDSLLIEPRYIDSDLPSTKFELYGKTFDTPIMTAALSHLGNTAENGMVIYAQAAAKANAVHWVGMGEDKELEDICVTGAATIKIIKPHADNKEVFRKIEHAKKAGCKGIQLSHHHGIMSYAVPPLMMLKEILEVVRGEIPVFIDCGIESGMDVYKCLALGATAVSVGRHLMPLLKKGPDATADRIKEMTGQLAATMARTGVKDLNSFDSSVIHQRKF